MIGYLKGKIISIEEKEVLILTESGVGYKVTINELTFAKLSEQNEVEIYIYHHKTENSENLFGFLDLKEEKVFKELIKISGIWWKVAMNILSIGINTLVEAVFNEDAKTIEKVNWIGKKWASKIILELKDNDVIKNFWIISSGKTEESILPKRAINTEIMDTLITMWFNARKVEEILSTLPDEITKTEEIIPYAIRNLS